MATINVGTGSGTIIIDGKVNPYKAGDIINIKAGIYSGITIQNIIIADGSYVTIQNDGGQVEVIGDTIQAWNVINMSNVKGVVLAGTSPGSFYFHNNRYRFIALDGFVSDLTFQNIKFDNIHDNVISFNNFNMIYTGAAGTYAKNMKFINLEASNCNTLISIGGSIDAKGVITGMVKGMEIANCNIHDCPDIGSAIYASTIEDYDVHNNTVNNVNQNHTDHPGIFFMQGNGKFHNNKITNHYGNALRAWTFTLGITPKTVLIYNNIVVNSRKYSGFETQGFSSLIVAGKTTYANARVFGNTCGNLNSNHDWNAGVVDVYNLFGGTCDVFDNISYNMYPTTGSNIANQQSSLVPKLYNNLYGDNFGAVGITDETTFNLLSTSKAIGAGIADPILTTDYYNNTRLNPPSIGAVEYNGVAPVPPVVVPPIVVPPVVAPPAKVVKQTITLYTDGTYTTK